MGFGLGSIGKIAGGAIGSVFGGSAGGLLGSAIGGMYDDNQLNKQYMHNQKLAWNMQNDYNNPVQQMARLRAAGLNPMLVYSSGNVTGNSSSDLNFSGATHNSAGDMFSRGLSDIYNNSVKQDLLQQRIAASQNLENNELDLQIKQAQLEYFQLRNDNLRNPVANLENPVSLLKDNLRLAILSKQLENLENGIPNGNVFNLNTWLGVLSKLGYSFEKSGKNNYSVLYTGARSPDDIKPRPRYDSGLLLNPW